MSIQKIIDAAIEREDGSKYTNHPSDTGGPTRWGITEKVARARGYAGDMRELPRGFAVAVYLHDYVNAPGFNKVLAVSDAIGEELVDTGINMGPGLPGPWLQRIMNVLNQQQRTFPDLVVDGAIGPATINALRTVIQQRGADGVTVILRMLNALQAVRYLELTEGRDKNEDFLFGWVFNRVVI